MSVDEARQKWERRFWEAYDGAMETASLTGFPEITESHLKYLVSVIDAIAEDGFNVQVVEHIQDRMFRGLVFWELTADEKKKLEEKRNEKHKGTDCGCEKNLRGGMAMMDYGSIFKSARQRAAAYKFYVEFSWERSTYGFAGEFDYLQEAYSFLCKPAHRDFIEFCAKKEAMTFDKYCDVMGISVDGLVAREPLTTIGDEVCGIIQKTR